MNTTFAKGSIAVIATVLLACTFSSCGGGSDESGGGGGSGTASSTDAQNASSAVVNTAITAFSEALSSFNGSVSRPAAQSLDPQLSPKASSIVVTEATSCAAVAAPDFGTLNFSKTVWGTDVAADGSGFCTLYVYGTTFEDFSAALICSSFSLGSMAANTTIDGEIDMVLDASDFEQLHTASAQIIVEDQLLLGFIENGQTRVCEILPLNFVTEVAVVETESTITIETSNSGCMTICDISYDISGGETQTINKVQRISE